MGRRIWRVNVRGEEHTVEVKRSIWTNAGKVRVDGEVVDAWGFRLWPEDRYFRVGKRPAVLRGTGLFPGSWQLFVDGEPVTLGGTGAPGCTTLRRRR